ncbi:MAG TPA: ABC transporter ATP-binding protein [Xanthomonadaceae bacterium]|nr:ABC transporter ATP-binding protein [Xanthomonadaceae bacterium]
MAVIGVRTALLVAARHQGRHAEVIRQSEAVLRDRESLLGSTEHPALAVDWFNLGVALQNVGRYGDAAEAARRAEKYLKQLVLWDKAHDSARALSGGMKRRLMIARAMMSEPRLLILDEPTAGVDIEIRRSMWKFISAINAAGTTVILTTHYLEEAEQLCRNIAIIDHGRIIENTSMRRLLAKLDVETFVLDLADPVGALPELPSVQLRCIDELTLEAEMARGHDLNSLFAALSAAGITVRSMRNKANRLEELFVRLIERDEAAA